MQPRRGDLSWERGLYVLDWGVSMLHSDNHRAANVWEFWSLKEGLEQMLPTPQFCIVCVIKKDNIRWFSVPTSQHSRQNIEPEEGVWLDLESTPERNWGSPLYGVDEMHPPLSYSSPSLEHMKVRLSRGSCAEFTVCPPGPPCRLLSQGQADRERESQRLSMEVGAEQG